MTAGYQDFEFLWEGVRIEIRYTPSWADYYRRIYGHRLAHLEIQSIDPPDSPLPVTETGYRSHFTSPEEVEDAGGPVAFVQAILDEAARSPAWIEREAAARQLSLF